MAKSKRHNFQKPKAGKQPQAKKHGKTYNIAEFSPYLDPLGLKIVQVTADGNCFFRVIADQLEGNEEEHNKYRLMVVKYMKDHRPEFEPFMEDNVSFDKHCDSMEKEGTWAGNVELQVCSLVTRCNICIHRLMSPRWYIRNFEDHGTRVIHLSYHSEEHYNSVRSKEDPCSGPARPVVIKADADLSATSHKGKAAAATPKGFSGKNVDKRSIQMVMSESGCESFERAEEVLQQVCGDDDAAIEFFIAEQITCSDLVEGVDLPSKSDAPDGDCGASVVPQKNTSESGQTENKNDEKLTHGSNSSKHSVKNLPAGGSKKKHKDCSVKLKSPTASLINHKSGARMSKKERKQAKKGGPVKVSPSSGSDGGLRPDVGALCI
ncbi:hypothetical protein MKX03_015727 [Papaver bracteatum]|nr:hypothetical protein MKX03_015727 [Papaver bracteatum]